MVLSAFLTVLALAGLALAATGKDCHAACKAVEIVISNESNVYYPGENEQFLRMWGRANRRTGDPLYTQGKSHFYASSEQDPACVVEPGTPKDVGEIVCPPSIFRRPH